MPHHVVLTVLYEVPAFTGRPVVDAVLGDWRVGVLQTLQSGPPFTVITAANTTNAFPGRAAAARTSSAIRDLPSGSSGRLSRWFNTAAFANPAPFTFGNSPRSVLRGPGIVTTDLTLEKTHRPWRQRARFDVRVEAYNLFNRANFNIPGFTLGAAGLRRDLERAAAADAAARRESELLGGALFTPTGHRAAEAPRKVFG